MKENFLKKEYITIITLLVSILSFVYSYHVDQKYLPLNEANVIFSEDNITIEPDYVFNNKKTDRLVLSFRNIGKFEANNVRFEMFLTAVNLNNLKINAEDVVTKVFDQTLIHKLQPNTTATIGGLFLNYDMENDKHEVINLRGTGQVALIFRLSYKDSLSEKIIRKEFLFLHTLGRNGISTLTTDDFPKIKENLKVFFINDPDMMSDLNLSSK